MARMLFCFKRRLGRKRKPSGVLERKSEMENEANLSPSLHSYHFPSHIFGQSNRSPIFPNTNRDRTLLLATFTACCRKNDIWKPWKAACRTRVSFLRSEIHFKQNDDLPEKLTPACVITACTWNSRCINRRPSVSSHGSTNKLPESQRLSSIADAYSSFCSQIRGTAAFKERAI